MKICSYTFTGYLPSGNSCLWFYDKNKNTSFATSNDEWTKGLEVGDKVEIHKVEHFRTAKVFINSKQVYSIEQKLIDEWENEK